MCKCTDYQSKKCLFKFTLEVIKSLASSHLCFYFYRIIKYLKYPNKSIKTYTVLLKNKFKLFSNVSNF